METKDKMLELACLIRWWCGNLLPWTSRRNVELHPVSLLYCKVFLDIYKSGEYKGEFRENLSLFNFEKGEDIHFSIDRSSNKMIVSNNVISLKEYDLKDAISEKCENILIRETYAPDGEGIYEISRP